MDYQVKEQRNSVASSGNTALANYDQQDVEKTESCIEEIKVYNPKDDPDHPVNWPQKKKYLALFAISLDSFIGYFTSAIYMPAVHNIMVYFNTDLTTIDATIALYLAFSAIAPLFWAPLSERLGRRWIYIVCLILYCVCTIVCGVSTNLGLFFAFRLLQSVFASAGQAVGGGSISDMFEPRERGKAMGLYMLGTILGPSIAPVCGGFINQNLGWRWIFYIKTIIGGAFAILSFFLVPESLYVPAEKRVAPPTNLKERLNRLKFNPFTSLLLLSRKETAVICIPVSIAFGWFYYLVTILSPTFGEIYGFSSGAIGLCFLASAVGNILGAICSGVLADKINNYCIARNGGVAVKEFRIRPIYVGLPFMVVGSLLYGWLLHARVNFMGPLVGFAMFCFGLMLSIAATNTYLVEANTSRAASAVSLNNFTRNMCGMIFSLTGVQIRESLGDGWSYTLASLMCLAAFSICVPLVQIFGAKWRREREQQD
ncbi:major facilitator superfamily domain-containing protein, partial [Parasitella parasitica]